jgi:hypothetical protein
MTTRVASLLLPGRLPVGTAGQVATPFGRVTWVTFFGRMICGGQQRRSAAFCGPRDLADASGWCLHLADIGCTVGTGARRGPPKGAGLNAQGHRQVQDRRPGMGRAYRGVSSPSTPPIA